MTTPQPTNPDGKKVTDGNQSGSIEERIDRLESVVNDLAERVEDLEEKAEFVEDKHDSRLDALYDAVQECEDSIEIINAHTGLSDVDDVEEAENTQPAESGSQDRDTTPLEDVVSLPEAVAEDSLTANQQRARFVAKDVVEYTRSVPVGRKIDAGEIGRVLRAGTDCSGHTATVDRVIKILDEFAQGKITVRRGNTGQREVVFHEELVEALVRANRQSRRCDMANSRKGVKTTN